MRQLGRLRSRFASLTSRLVVTTVVLVAAISLLVGGATAIAMRSYLTDRLDADVEQALRRAELGPTPPFAALRPLDGGPDGVRRSRGGPDVRGQGVGTLTAYFSSTDDTAFGDVIDAGENGSTERTTLTDRALSMLVEIPTDGQVQQVVVPGVGTYRIAATEQDGLIVLAGLPSVDVDEAVASLIAIELLLAVAAVVLAGGLGLVVVRRQLRPLREVAATAHSVASIPLSSGEVGLTERVPAHLTAADTEVGQVGSALNSLLEHVETSLSARHRSEQQVRQFVADASHELRTPLTTIAGYTELARRRPDDTEATRAALVKVEEESSRMTALVEDLLLLARLDAGRPLVAEPVDLTRLLLEAVEDARVVAPEHRWSLELGPEPVEVIGDEQRLHQVVTNLLTNARKYTPPGTTIRVAVRPDGFSVHDDGPGFPADLVGAAGRTQPAFERFARGDASRHRAGGVGLGLSLVRAIVSAHGGTVALASRPGDTAIAVTLPPMPPPARGLPG